MPNTVVVGSQWGDEGKAKIIDYLTKNSDVIIRFQGGANAGHTVIAHGEKFIFHVVPSGIMYPDKIGVIGNGVVFDAEQFIAEVDELKTRGIEVEGRLFISDLAHLVLPYHKLIDNMSESSKKNIKIGTTGRGIGPAYADKVNRIGIRTGDLYDWDTFKSKVEAAFTQKKTFVESMYGGGFDLNLQKICEQYKIMQQKIVPFLTDSGHFIFTSLQENKKLLFEGAQGTFLDIDHGTFPFVTSSNTISASACIGSGVSPFVLDHVVGIVKAYTTRVGNGPFPTELDNEIGALMQQAGNEFGATTGRPRRCGWLDMVMLRKSYQLNGFTRIAVTKLDVLNKFDEIKICTHYEINGKKIEHFPSYIKDYGQIIPMYESYPGWKEDISGCTELSALPKNAQVYLNRISELCYNVPIFIVSVGPDRQQTIQIESLH